MSETNAPDIKRDIAAICDAVGQAILTKDVASSRNAVNLQSIDNSLICSYLFAHDDAGFITDRPDQEVNFLGFETFRIANKLITSLPFKMIVTLPTLLETGNSFLNIARKLSISSERIANDRIYDRVMRMLDPSDQSGDVLVTNDYLHRTALEFCSLLPSAMRTDNLDTFLRLIKDGAVTGLGEYYSHENYLHIKAKLLEVTTKINLFLNKNRERRHGESESAFEFRNKIDALNFAIPHALQKERNDVRLSFVTPFAATLDRQAMQLCDREIRGVLRARTLPVGLYLLLRSIEITEPLESVHSEASHWLEALAKRAEICKSYLERAENPTQISDTRKREIFLFYEDFMGPLFGSRQRASASDDDTLRKARELFTSKEAFRDRFQKAGEKIDSAAKELMSVRTVINSEELLTDFGLLNDPRVRAIRSKYNLG